MTAVRPPGREAPGGEGDEPAMRRVLVLLESFQASANTLSQAARLVEISGGVLWLVHARVLDQPAPWYGGGPRPETSEEATLGLEAAVTFAWTQGVPASGVVVETERSRVADAVVAEASQWGADLIMLTASLRRTRSPAAWDRTTRRVMRSAACQVIIVYPGQY